MPVAVKRIPIVSSSVSDSQRGSAWLLVRTATIVQATPSRATKPIAVLAARLGGRQPGSAHGSSAATASPDRSALATKPQAPQAEIERPEVARVAAGDDHDPRRLVERVDAVGDDEAVDVGQADVEQHDVRVQLAHGDEPGGAVGRLADDEEAAGLHHALGAGAERRVVVDDEDRAGHRQMIVAELLHGQAYG